MVISLILLLPALAWGLSFNVSVDCEHPLPFLAPFWRSVGYTPAEHSLRIDELENTANIGAVPRRGVTQVRIHYLLDLVTVLGFTPSPDTPSGFRLEYEWGMLDYATDFLVANGLSPGFEMMGSPDGFPSAPSSFNNTYNGNGHIYPNQTLSMWRQLVGDLLARYIARYGRAEVEAWHLETWNEPDQGWGWAKVSHLEDPILASFVAYWDATAAGVEDAEAATGARLYFGGTASGRAAGDALFLVSALNHKARGRNALTGAPVRWDYISAHVKGQSTSYVTVQGEWALSALLRSNPEWAAPGAGLLGLPISNDEGDPMVGWENPQAWRGDARYAAIIPKMVAQHATSIGDNATNSSSSNNPLGWLSFDGAFMNGVDDTYTGFGMRTMTARFGAPGPGAAAAGSSPYAFVRKSGLAAFALLARLPWEARCSEAHSGGGGSGDVLGDNAGVLTGVDGAAGEVGVLVFNSADCTNDTHPAISPTIELRGLPFPPSATSATASSSSATQEDPSTCVGVVYWVDDAPQRSTFSNWTAAGSPTLPSPEQLKALWAAGAAMGAALGPPVPLTLLPCSSSSSSSSSTADATTTTTSCLTLPPLPGAAALPLPGLLLWHIALKAAAPPSPPPPASPHPHLRRPRPRRRRPNRRRPRPRRRRPHP